LLASSGLFLGAIINANIFSELAVILSTMDKQEKQFQMKFASINTAMINLKLPEEVAQNVRIFLNRNIGSFQSQNSVQ